MKKLLLILSMAFLCSGISYSQGGTTYFGLKGGISLSSYGGEDWDTTVAGLNGTAKSRGNFTGALAVNSHIGEWLLLKHEFWLSNKGSSIEYNNGWERSYNRWYMDLAPIQFGVNLKGFQVFAGPQAGLLLFKKDVVYNESGEEVWKDEDQEGESILDYGFIAGSEYEFPFGLNMGVRYVQGMRGIDEDGELDWKNATIMITAGWTFGKDL